MADRAIQFGSQGNILRVFIRDLSDNNGAGKTGLLFSTTSLLISTICDNEATATSYAAASTTQTVATLGTYVAPVATKCSFKLVDDTNHPGLYELHLADARFGVPGAKELHITLSGASDMSQTEYVVDLIPNRGALGRPLWG